MNGETKTNEINIEGKTKRKNSGTIIKVDI